MTSEVVSLRKGGVISLRKVKPKIKTAKIDLIWNGNVDLDLSCFCLSLKDGNPIIAKNKERNFVFYGNDSNFNGAVYSTGDVKGGSEQMETIYAKLDEIEEDISELAFWISIYTEGKMNQTFADVTNALVKISDADTNEVVAEYNLDDYKNAHCFQFGSLFRKGDWEFTAIGNPVKVDLLDVCVKYGMQVSY